MGTIRSEFKAAVLDEQVVFAPLCMDPMTARLCEQIGYRAGYLGGGALGYSLAVSEALLTVNDLSCATAAIQSQSCLPIIVDVGAGFGDPVHVTRTVRDLETVGAAALEIDDEVAPKRASHHRGIEHLISSDEMTAKIRVAVAARNDPDMLLIARTNAIASEGFDAAIERGRAYVDAGADVIIAFPETLEQWQELPARFQCPVATIEVLSVWEPEQWAAMGYALVMDGITGQVVAYEALRSAYQSFGNQDDQAPRTKSDLMAVYKDFADVTGMAELYAIEDATTERCGRAQSN